MNLIPLTEDKYDVWNDCCLKSNDAFFWHTTYWMEYSMQYRPEFQSKNLSFMVEENKQILAICPLLLERVDGNTDNLYILREGINEHPVTVPKYDIFEFRYGGGFISAPAIQPEISQKKRERILSTVFDRIDELAKENHVVRALFAIYPLSFPAYNYLVRYGYNEVSLNTQVLSLTQDMAQVHAGLSKGHDYDIDRGLKYLTVRRVDSRECFDQYYHMFKDDPNHSYETRPDSTFDMQYEWIQKGYAHLFQAVLNETTYPETVGFSYVFTYKDKAYYGSACNDHAYSDLPIAHVLNWKTIEWLKTAGYKWYEVGWQQYSPQPFDLCSDKEIAISKFKRGFGGLTLPIFRGEKYYDSDYYLKVNRMRIEQYARELDRKNQARV